LLSYQRGGFSDTLTVTAETAAVNLSKKPLLRFLTKMLLGKTTQNESYRAANQ